MRLILLFLSSTISCVVLWTTFSWRRWGIFLCIRYVAIYIAWWKWVSLVMCIVCLLLASVPWMNPQRHTVWAPGEMVTPVGGVVERWLRPWRHTLRDSYGDLRYLMHDDASVSPGDYVTLRWRSTYAEHPRIMWTWSVPDPSFPLWLSLRWYAWSIHVTRVTHAREPSWYTSHVHIVYEDIRAHILDRYAISDIAWLLIGILIGDVSTMTLETYLDIQAVWMTHIVAVSGANIALVILLLHILLFFLPVYIRRWCICILVCCYAWFTWWESSVLRALCMTIIVILCLLWWRRIHGWRARTLSYCLLLSMQPLYLLYDAWFVLSFSALWWILIMHKYFTVSTTRGVGSLQAYIYTSVGAWRGVTPMVLLLFDEVVLWNILPNIFILRTIPLFTWTGLASLLVSPTTSMWLYSIYATQWFGNLLFLLVEMCLPYMTMLSVSWPMQWLFLLARWATPIICISFYKAVSR